jgi:predicted alpha/beta hydrolase family esterase
MGYSIITRIKVFMRTLIVPGLNGSGLGHWQTLWAEKYCFERVEQRNWEKPDLDEWVSALNAVVSVCQERTILVAHSLGCLTVAHWAQAYPKNADQIWCALLVTPPNVERSVYVPEELRRFATQELIPFPSVLVGSENDPYMTLESARKLAICWGSSFINAGKAGHINLDSGHGQWPEGEALLWNLIKIKTILNCAGNTDLNNFPRA